MRIMNVFKLGAIALCLGFSVAANGQDADQSAGTVQQPSTAGINPGSTDQAMPTSPPGEAGTAPQDQSAGSVPNVAPSPDAGVTAGSVSGSTPGSTTGSTGSTGTTGTSSP